MSTDQRPEFHFNRSRFAHDYLVKDLCMFCALPAILLNTPCFLQRPDYFTFIGSSSQMPAHSAFAIDLLVLLSVLFPGFAPIALSVMRLSYLFFTVLWNSVLMFVSSFPCFLTFFLSYSFHLKPPRIIFPLKLFLLFHGMNLDPVSAQCHELLFHSSPAISLFIDRIP